MKKVALKAYAFWILLTEAVGALSGFLTRKGTKAYQMTVKKPPLSPPGIVFPIVWSILYALMGIGAARVAAAKPSAARSRSMFLFFLQLAFNFFWSILFFNLGSYGLALIWLLILWVLIILMIVSFCKVDKTAAYLQIPYLLWVTFAAYLNYGVWRLNG